MTQHKTYKFKLVPNKQQEKSLNHFLGTTRFIYNLCLNYKSILYSHHGISISKYDMQKELTEIKNETPWMKDVHSQVIQETTDRLFKAYDNFFRRAKQNKEKAGFPKFARKDFWSSFKYKQGVSICENTNKVKLPKIGKVKFRKSQDIKGQIKNASLKKEHDGWYICLCCEIDRQIKTQKSKESKEESIGIDLGVKTLVVTSKGKEYSNPKTLYAWHKKLARVQRELARRKKGSNNRYKTKKKLKKIHGKISRIRRDNLHKISTQLVSENQVIICENLNTRGMLKNHNLARSISDASWGMLIGMLDYKCDWDGGVLHKVAPQYTSQDCHVCGWRNKDLKLSDRSWDCEGCGAHHDRDVNAGINIEIKGIKELKEAGHVFSTFGDMDGVSHPAEEPHKIAGHTV